MSRRGSSVVEAVVAAALAGIALAGLAATAGMTVAGLRLARDGGTALALAAERLETLRAGPRASGTDAPIGADGTPFARTWSVADGRGAPSRLSAQVAWGRHVVTLATEAFP